MGKRQIKNYVFKPGIGALGNLYPNAYSLLSDNKDFLIAESIAYINQEILDATKCQRDIGYIIDGAAWDVALGTNYNATFLGIAEVNSLELSNTVKRTIQRAKTKIEALGAVQADATALSRTTAFFNELLDIINNGRSSADSLTLSNPTSATPGEIAASQRLLANKEFLAAEINAWVALNYPSADHDPVKCSRDVKYAINALAYDILYGGNSATYDQAKFFFYGFSSGAPGIDPTHKAQTVAAYNRLQAIVQQVVLGTLVSVSTGNTQTQNTSGANATSTEASRLSTLVQITEDVVNAASQAAALTVLSGITRTVPGVTWTTSEIQAAKSAIDSGKTTIINDITWSPTYTYNSEKCQRDLGYVLDAYLNDLRYGGNQKIRDTIKYYWDGAVAQVDGNRIPEIDTHAFIGDLIEDYILANVAWTPGGTETQVIDLSKTAEPAGITKLSTLVQNTVDVITNGLGSMPAAETAGVGHIKIQGRYDTEDLLLITNTTRNEIIYNFSNNATGGSISLKTYNDDADFVTWEQTTDAVTTITLNYNTSDHDPTDDLQIFVESKEVRVRPYDFGTDAIERMRIAPPMSMLDADFEYGLQPTKWSAIGTLRGYPSVYEVPGTDTPVQSVVTDASSGTSGVGQSLITVTTVGPHGFAAGQPITIKALENSVNGAARAEGSFIITTVPSTTTFTYYAKAKVGTTNGQVLSTTYTQLRKAGFYTGANIGNPVFSVISQGTSGSISAELDVPSGSTIIPFDGPSPEVGAPLSNIRIPVGTQVTGVIDTSAGGGVYITPLVEGDYNSGVTEIDLVNVTGVVPNLAADSGDLTATFIESVAGNTLTFSSPFNTNIKGNRTTYANLTGINQSSIGTGATFNISRAAGIYTVDSIATAGQDYEIGDRIKFIGTLLGGVTPDHDLVLIVDSVNGLGGVTGTTVEGTAFDGTYTVENLTPNTLGGSGIGAQFSVTYTNGSFTSVTVTAGGSGYTNYDRIVIPGNLFTPLGTPVINDLKITVTTTGPTGDITGISYAGTAPNAQVTYTNPTYTTSGGGSGIDFTVTRSGVNYTVNFNIGGFGTGFNALDTITVLGTQLGGTSPTNDLVITVDNVDGTGAITAYSESGTAINSDTKTGLFGENLIGSGLEIDVSLNAGTYSVSIVSGGLDYAANQSILIPGTSLVGASPANDLTLTIATVSTIGAVLTLTVSGVAASGTGSYTNVLGVNEAPAGSNARFDVLRNLGTYTTTLNTTGTGYKVGNRILLEGSILGGSSPINDLLIRVTGVSPSGAITSFVDTYTEAEYGINLDLYSVILISESTTGLIARSNTITYSALATLQVDFATAHGLVPGDTFITTVASDNGSNNHALAAGAFFASDIPSATSLRYQARAAGAINTSGGLVIGSVYPRPDSFFIHRPYDGGVQLGTGGPQHGAQAIRQSKKYIRYQSGKGIMYTTGALFAPSYDLRSVTASGLEVNSLITVVTDDNDHGVQVGGVVRLLGIETPGYNSGPGNSTPPWFDYEVVNVIDERTFQIRAQRRLGATSAVLGFAAQMSVVSWHGATVRSGIFDDQNGIFWEYDGTQISVVQRTGTKQISGTIAMTVDNNLVTGTNTKFRDQLKAGDRIIIKGMTHVVSHVISQTEMTVTPDWRGVVNIAGTKANLVVDKKVKQRDFNLDRLDGTGPSGYNLDPAKMQMIGIQYSWYGAGFIDFMLRGSDGNFVFAHRMRNSNVNTEAFMRSGNLPVRYEVTNEGPPGKLAAHVNPTQTTLELEDASFFPTSGVVYIDNEIISFTGKSDNHLTGLVRAASFSNFQAGADRTYTAGPAANHEAKTGVILISNTITPLISHWGSAFLTDGGFDEDRGYIFNYAATNVSIGTTKQTAFLIRLAPSVSNAIVGDLGERELLNRAQLLLQSIEITSNTPTSAQEGGIVVEGVLNPQNYPINPADVGWTGLSGVAQGGQPSFAQVASGGSVVWSTGASATTQTATSIGSITAVLDSGLYTSGFNAEYIFVSASDYRATFGSTDVSQVLGRTITGTFIPANTTIREAFISGSDNYGYFRLTNRTTGTINAGTTAAFTVVFNTELINRNFAYLTTASFNASGARVGTAVTGGSVTFPSNTTINRIRSITWAGNTFYEVQFNNSFTGTLAVSTGTVQFTFVSPPFAQPGETVFSFIAKPGERAELSLEQLKELTNTALGGRGVFPNGPDVLAVNVYKVSGDPVTSNIILRWGEAQA